MSLTKQDPPQSLLKWEVQQQQDHHLHKQLQLQKYIEVKREG
jgi:hypothetical protein